MALANALSIADFGLFATASAAGVMLSRILAFGFVSQLYRIATVRPRLIGVFTAGFLLLSLLSLPFLAAASWAAFALFFAGTMPAGAFATVIVAEALLGRPNELVMIVNNGMGRFGRAATLAIISSAIRAAAAVIFIAMPASGLTGWSLLYLAANAVSLAVAILFYYPRQALVLKTGIYFKRLPDALYVAGAEVLFYLQIGAGQATGAGDRRRTARRHLRHHHAAGRPDGDPDPRLHHDAGAEDDAGARNAGAALVRAGIEGGIFAVSTLALLCLAILLHFFPGVLGRNVAEAAPLIGLAIMVPGLRNLVEYQAELLFGRGQMMLRALNLAVLAGVKAVLLIWLLGHVAATQRPGAVAQRGLCGDLPGFGAAHLQRLAAAVQNHLSDRRSRRNWRSSLVSH